MLQQNFDSCKPRSAISWVVVFCVVSFIALFRWLT